MTTKVDDATPKPCPFCGAKAKVRAFADAAQVECGNHDICHVASGVIAKTMERAIQLWNTRAADPTLAAVVAERDALLRFKQYVHKRLDDAGVTVDPESSHKAEGCRIGGRLDEVLGKVAERDAAVEALKFYAEERNWEVMLMPLLG